MLDLRKFRLKQAVQKGWRAPQNFGGGEGQECDGLHPARKALGHAYGGGSQYYSMWVVGSDKPADQPAGG